MPFETSSSSFVSFVCFVLTASSHRSFGAQVEQARAPTFDRPRDVVLRVHRTDQPAAAEKVRTMVHHRQWSSRAVSPGIPCYNNAQGRSRGS